MAGEGNYDGKATGDIAGFVIVIYLCYMRPLLTTLIAILAVTIAGAQDFSRETHEILDCKDEYLYNCMLNIGMYPHGFIWVDLHGHSWWVLENPAITYDRAVSEEFSFLTVNAFLSYNALDLARQEGWPVFSGRDILTYTPGPNESHPPVFLQTDKHDKSLCR